MSSKDNQNISDEFIVKYDKANFKLYLVLLICALSIALYSRWEKFGSSFSNGLITYIPPFVVILGLLGYYYFNSNVKLKISKKGIWTRKYELLEWDQIWYFDFTSDSSWLGGNQMCFHFKLKDSEEEYKLPIAGLDCSLKEIYSALKKYAPSESVLNLGITENT